MWEHGWLRSGNDAVLLKWPLTDDRNSQPHNDFILSWQVMANFYSKWKAGFANWNISQTGKVVLE